MRTCGWPSSSGRGQRHRARDRSARLRALPRTIRRTGGRGRWPSCFGLKLGPARTATHLVRQVIFAAWERHGTGPLPTPRCEARRERGRDQEGLSQASPSSFIPTATRTTRTRPSASARSRRPTTCCRTRTSARDTTAARSTRTAIPRCRSAWRLRRLFGGRGGRSRAARRFENFDFGGADAADFSDLFEGLFGGGARRAAAAGGPFGGFRQRAARRKRAPTSPIGSKVPFDDAAALKPQRITLRTARRSTSSSRRGSRTAPRSGSPARARRGRAAMATRSSRSRSKPHRFFTPRGRQHPARPAGDARRGGARRQGQGADSRGR